MFKDNNLYFSNITGHDGDNGEIIPLLSNGDEDWDEKDIPENLPILPVKKTVLFPGVVIPITVGRQKSIKLVKEAYKGSRIIGVVAQKNESEEPQLSDLYEVGTVAQILKMIVLPDGSTTIIIQGKTKFQYTEITAEEPFLRAKISLLKQEELETDTEEKVALIHSMRDLATKMLKMNPDIPQEAEEALENIDNPSFLTFFLGSNLNAEVEDKQEILEMESGFRQATKVLDLMNQDYKMLLLKQEIQNKVNTDIDQQQREYFLRQQIKVLQEELGQESSDNEIQKLKDRAKEKKWSKQVQELFDKEINKLQRINPAAAEYPLTMNYVEYLLDLPWNEYTEDNFDLKRAKKILDKDHYGMDKVKDRVLEYLAVLKLKGDMKAPIVCLYGPPGVGKTSLGRSVAKALDRKYVRMSLGGLHDESEIRGHRRTYIGAMPGKVMQNIKKAASSNPVFILDEIDKVGSDFRGDPSSALLEVLDPEQNTAFTDNYIEVPYDLSKTIFIATANSLDTIQPALRDRMEIIEINGYTVEEKVEIAKKHLVPKQRKENGLKAKDISFTPKSLERLVTGYTRESGVRELERQVGSIMRKIASKIALEEKYDKSIKPGTVEELLKASKYDKEDYQEPQVAGVVAGLAWTRVGGEILYVETSLSKGKGKLSLSGQLGDVMKESATAALSYLKAHAQRFGLDHRLFDQYDVHVHVPAGAVPKDGPSAGITMLTALASSFTQKKPRAKTAMTGEITLRGKVLPVGGIKEKILAAKRAGIDTIVLSKKNQKDIEEIEADYLKGLDIHYVESVDEVLEFALTEKDAPQKLDLSLEKRKETKEVSVH